MPKYNDCTCNKLPGDDYYCSVHGGEGCLIDLVVKSDILIEALGDWIANQDDGVKKSATSAFGQPLKELTETLRYVKRKNNARRPLYLQKWNRMETKEYDNEEKFDGESG
jgi:hypothetical protein